MEHFVTAKALHNLNTVNDLQVTAVIKGNKKED